MYSGIINVYKEKGFTSFDVVAKLRGILKQKKIGHTGTLDPDAEGVLVVCLGKATKLCEMLTEKDKCYEAVMRLGVTTDTEDSSGSIISNQEVTINEQQIKRIAGSFVGGYDQIPPMYSAIKIDGRKLYELARQGVQIERKPRHVEIYDISISKIELPLVYFSVSCGKGTYIRSLCRDMGDKAGCGAIMESLVRSSVKVSDTGIGFNIEDALTLDEIEDLVRAGTIDDHILSMDSLFPDIVKLYVTDAGDKKLKNGNILFAKDFVNRVDFGESLPEREKCDNDIKHTDNKRGQILVYDCDGIFTAIYEYNEKIHGWKAYKMFI